MALPRDDLEKNELFLFHQAGRLMRRNFDRKSKAYGLTRSQWYVLAAIAQEEGLVQGSIAELLDMEPMALVRILDKLCEMGLTERRTHESDRRARAVYLKAAAGPMIECMREFASQTLEEALEGFTDTDRKQLAALLQRICANLADREAPDVAPEISRVRG